MYEIILTIVEMLKKGYEGLQVSESRREKRLRRELGLDLALLYNQIRLICSTGREIVRLLESYVKAMESDPQQKDNEIVTQLKESLLQNTDYQQIHIARLRSAIQGLSIELELLQPGIRSAIEVLLQLRSGVLSVIVYNLSFGRIPVVELAEGELENLLKEDVSLASVHDVNAFLREKLLNNSFFIPEQWDKEVELSIRKYLEQWKPLTIISRLEKIASDLRAQILQHFSLADILVDIRDTKLSNES